MTKFENFIAQHAPSPDSSIPAEKLGKLIQDGTPVNMIVMAADIRSSTLLMKEAVDFRKYAFLTNTFITVVAKVIRAKRGWFDKFTGDGFLAYWVVDDEPIEQYFDEVLTAAGAVVGTFRRKVVPELLRNSRNAPTRLGVSVGLDAGPAYFVEVASDLTVVGPPVVGAVRMVGAADPYEVLANIYLGKRIEERLQEGTALDGTVTQLSRPTKEFAGGQILYSVHLPNAAMPDRDSA